MQADPPSRRIDLYAEQLLSELKICDLGSNSIKITPKVPFNTPTPSPPPLPRPTRFESLLRPCLFTSPLPFSPLAHIPSFPSTSQPQLL
eukprot:471276-Hanusia_phi.AAC.1